MQTDVVQELKVLHLASNRKSTDGHTEGSLIKIDLKVSSHSHTLPPPRLYFLNSATPSGIHFLSSHHIPRPVSQRLIAIS